MKNSKILELRNNDCFIANIKGSKFLFKIVNIKHIDKKSISCLADIIDIMDIKESNTISITATLNNIVDLKYYKKISEKTFNKYIKEIQEKLINILKV